MKSENFKLTNQNTSKWVNNLWENLTRSAENKEFVSILTADVWVYMAIRSMRSKHKTATTTKSTVVIHYDSINTEGEYTSHFIVSSERTWSSIHVPFPLENCNICANACVCWWTRYHTNTRSCCFNTSSPLSLWWNYRDIVRFFLCWSQTQFLTLSSDPKHRMAHAPTADNSSTASLKLTDISTYVSATVRLEQHVEDFSEESGVLQGTKVCSMEADERRGEDKRQEMV